MKACMNENRLKKMGKSSVPKGNAIPDSKPENGVKKVAKAAVKARAADKKK